ncbi:hypothetical protein BABINDRAFT_160161 [Babjeviella inositovora NRRL Y-12698]|uniref:Vacuolar protein sorting-associated protein 74 n=1 Tax=Babjeviella inositovora NRRL Y-12698 TaxID=984486 RepID=A0A1E3QWC4_9ASCO|nr:uncharacterized protein BABINDRAFT_160161 [Babjeviella inositovora NRRL Y-12698]ODQ81940.1 hypothetical protein BABINDRAFT_160161 [Babjeviella inositovora NRRL Y-12698]
MSSGLQRRRGGKATHETEDSPEAPEHKIAYDPRDMEDTTELKAPLLTLMEEVLLMGLKDKEGYLSFWNDNISYALRGCILLELAFRGRIALVNDPSRRRFELSERLIEVIDATPTGEVLLDETLKLMKNDESNLSVSNWIDLLSGETWNLMKINYQLKQVRERLAKGLVDKGILRTERKNFFLFDMATHPVADATAKDAVKKRVLGLVVARSAQLTYNDKFPEAAKYKYLRTISLVCAAYAANVLENVLNNLGYDQRDAAFARADEILAGYSTAPFTLGASVLGVSTNLAQEVSGELVQDGVSELQAELFAAVLSVFSRMDSIL